MMKGASLLVVLCLIMGIIGINGGVKATNIERSITSDREQYWSTTMVAGAGGVAVTGGLILSVLGLGGLSTVPVIGTVLTAVLGVIGTLGSAVLGFPILSGGSVLIILIIGIILAILGPIGVGLAAVLGGGATVSILGASGTVISAVAGPIIGLIGLAFMPVILLIAGIPSMLSITSALFAGVFTCLTGGGLSVAFDLVLNGLFTGIAGLPMIGQFLNLCLTFTYPMFAVFNTVFALGVNLIMPFITPFMDIIGVVFAPFISIFEVLCGPVITALIGPIGRVTTGVMV
jgi:hypothetical protein